MVVQGYLGALLQSVPQLWLYINRCLWTLLLALVAAVILNILWLLLSLPIILAGARQVLTLFGPDRFPLTQYLLIRLVLCVYLDSQDSWRADLADRVEERYRRVL